MGDPLQHVQPGSPLVIQAEAWNRIVDAAGRAEGSRRFDGGAGDARRIPTRPAVYIDVKNTTGGSVANRAILSPTGVVVDPATNPDLAADGPTVVAAAPTSDSDPVLIAVQPIPDGTVGRAVVAGVTVAQVSVTSTSHRFAKPIAGTSTHLASAAAGPIRLLMPPTTTGTQMAYVLLGGAVTSTGDGGGGTDGNCFGDGWRVGLTPDDEWALRVFPDGESVYIEDGATVEINGVEYTIDFNYLTPSLTLTSSLPSAAPIAGTLDCTACPCLKFSFARAAFGLDATVPRGFCARILYVTVCQYCPAGWYCARDAGTDDPFEPVELPEGAACSPAIEVKPGGPYVDEAAAIAVCGPITAPCCGDVEMSRRFRVTIANTNPEITYCGVPEKIVEYYPTSEILVPGWRYFFSGNNEVGGGILQFYCSGGQWLLYCGSESAGGSFATFQFPIAFDCETQTATFSSGGWSGTIEPA